MKAFLLPLLMVPSMCSPELPKPNPVPTEQAPAPALKTYMEFRVYDAGDGDQFNAALSGDVFYFPLSWSESQIRDYFGNPERNENWNAAPRMADETYEVENEVSQWGYTANPGSFLRYFEGSKRVVIVWTFTEANPNARRAYRQQFYIYSGEGENQVIKTDRHRAGL